MGGGGGMSGGFTNQTQTMESVANQFDEVNRQLKTRFERLRNDMIAAKEGWQGQAGTAFQTLMQKYDDDAQKLNQALYNIAQNLHANQKQYVQAQIDTAQAVSDIQKALG